LQVDYSGVRRQSQAKETPSVDLANAKAGGAVLSSESRMADFAGFVSLGRNRMTIHAPMFRAKPGRTAWLNGV
jgi:hypothetical protein